MIVIVSGDAGIGRGGTGKGDQGAVRGVGVGHGFVISFF